MSEKSIQQRIDELEVVLSETIKHPEWFANPTLAREWIEDEIQQLEAEELAEIENDRLAEQSLSKQANIILFPILSR